jgi:hypothetical protein
MVIRPSVKIKPIEGDSGFPQGNFDQIRPDVAGEDRRPYTEISRCLCRTKQPREEDRQHVTASTKP